MDYLLEDDEEPESGRGKLALLLVALVLAGAFGYLHWRQGGFDWVQNGKKPALAAEGSDTSSSSRATPTSPPSDSGSNPPVPAANSASGNSASPSAANNPPASGVSETPNASASSSPANEQPATPAPSANDQTPAPEKSAADTKAAPAAEKSPETNSGDSTNPEPEEITKPAQAPKRLRKPTPVTPVDVSAEAERYIFGRGVQQDCDRGLRLMKSAAQTEPKAMIKLGVLYSSGTCAPRDLPTAYRWFAMALHKDPNNQALQDDLQQLWRQMTQPERQLAIKLSQ